MAIIKSVLVIGGTGFIGAPFVAELAKRGVEKISVAHMGALTEVAPSHALYYRIDAAGAELADLVRTHDAIAVLVQPNDAIIKNILKLAKTYAPKHILYTSTTLLYKGGDQPQKEDAPLEAVTAYEKSKLREERLIAGAARGKTKVTIARLGNVYGDILNKGIISYAFAALLRRGTFEVRGKKRVRDYIHVDDVAALLAEIMLRPAPKALEYINVSTGVGTSTEQLLDLVEKVAGSSLARTEGKDDKDTERVIADNAKLIKRIGAPRYTLKKGLALTHERYRAWYDLHNTRV